MRRYAADALGGHPVFASRLKKRLSQDTKLTVIDPRRIDLVRTPHAETALVHVIVTEGFVNEAFMRDRCD